MADTEFPIPVKKLRERLLQLHHHIEQGVVPDDEESTIVDLVFAEDELEWIEENHPILFEVLLRIGEEYEAVRQASDSLEVSEGAAGALVRVIQIDEEKGDGEAPKPRNRVDEDEDEEEDRD